MAENLHQLLDDLATLRAALRDPAHPFRYIRTLARKINRSEDETAILLRDQIGATQTFGREGGELWCNFNNWQLETLNLGFGWVGRVKRDEDNHAIPRELGTGARDMASMN